MKIIITESQKNKLREGLLELINEYGFKSVAESQGMSKLRLAKMVDLPIYSESNNDNEVIVRQLLKDLVEIDDVYNECDLIYDSMSRSIHWSCRFDDGEQIIKTLTYATPYYNDNDMTPVETNEFEVIKDEEKEEEYGSMSNDYWTSILSPTEFNNVDKLIDWFENDYKPVVYKTIKRHLKDFKERYT
jgi:hypothetical protein